MNSQKPIKVKSTVVGEKSNRFKRIVFNVNTILGLILLIILVPAISNRLKNDTKTNSQDQVVVIDSNRQNFKEAVAADVVEKISPSVVSIIVSNQSSFYSNVGAGTGVIISKKGYILTSKHVIDGLDNITIIDHEGESYNQVEVIYKDPLNDLAFLKVTDLRNPRPITIGDSKTIKPGQQVLAIGNSLGQYQNTVTKGIVSGTKRNIMAKGNQKLELLTDMIQTDAAINPGNSGGPLVNAGGQLIAINTAVTQGANGLGFAIPIGAAKGIIKQLESGQEIQRAMLGVRYVALDPQVAEREKVSEKQGALISSKDDEGIIAGSPAEKAGLKKGDIITKINGAVVGKDGGLSTLVSEFSPGDKISVEVKRQQKVLLFAVQFD